jgi:hypothetical protein
MKESLLTILAIPKPFSGHIGIIQRNAIASWTKLRPRPDIYVFGDEQGVAEIAAELKIHHVSDLARSEFGTPMLDDLMLCGREIADTPLLAYVNSDIMLLQECLDAVVRIREQFSKFLAVAYRLNIELAEALNFEADGEMKLRREIVPHGVPGDPTAIDLFVFTPNVYEKVPPFAIGRGWFDQWLIKEACRQRIPIVDVTNAACAIHQNHEYAHIGGSLQGVLSTEEGQRNLALYGGRPHAYSLLNATHELLPDGTVRRVRFRREGAALRSWFWSNFIQSTAGLRAKIGLQRSVKAASQENSPKA